MKDEGVPESDDDKTPPRKEKKSTQILDPLDSPSALADDAADLNLASPKPAVVPSSSLSPSEEAIQVEAIEAVKQHPVTTLAEGPTSKDAFADSIVHLSAQDPPPASSTTFPQSESTAPEARISESLRAQAPPLPADFASALGPTPIKTDALAGSVSSPDVKIEPAGGDQTASSQSSDGNDQRFS